MVAAFIQHTGFTFAKAERAAATTALHLAHEVNPNADEQQHGSPADQKRHQKGTFFAGFDIKLDAIGNQIAHQASIKIGGRGAHFALVVGDSHNFCAALPLLYHRALDVLASNFF